MIKIARIYDSYDLSGYRVLIDRIWPRGVSKDKANLDLWAKNIAPTKDLRTWFNHEDDKFPEFKKKYFQELKQNSEVPKFLEAIKNHTDTILLFSAKNEAHNNAVVLLEYLKKELT